MAIKIKINVTPGKVVERILLKAKKTIDGNIIVSDHPEIDIIIIPKTSKLVVMPKDEMDDEVHDTQRRLMKILTSRGVIDFETIQAGNIFMSMEAKIPDAVKGDKVQYILYVLSDFLESDLPFYSNQKQYEKEMEDSLLEPEPDEYTEYDPEKYHKEKKGSMSQYIKQYGIGAIYRI